MRVVVTGATGFLGTPLVARLIARGDRVTVLTRRPRGAPGVDEVAWHPEGSVGPWASAIEGADAVVHLAGESIGGRRWTRARKTALVDSRLRSTRSLVAAIEKATSRPRVLLSSSAVGYYGPRGGETVTEDTPAGHDFLARLCVDWEQAARHAEGLGPRVVTLRSGLILAADGGALTRMLLPFRLGVGGPVGSGSQYWPWIHRDDWLSLVEFLLAHPAASGPVNLTAPTPLTNQAFSRALARVLRRPCLFRVPAFLLRGLLGELSDAVLTGQRALPARALSLGFTFQYEELETALTALLGGGGRAD
jgi:uncharacterized protein